MRRRLVPGGLAVAIVLAAALFILRPQLDLTVASALYKGDNRFVGQNAVGEAIRRVVYWVPAAIAAGLTLLYLAQRLGAWAGWAPSGRGVIVLLLSFALGPGLLTNVVLKNHSHRPRPYQTVAFGGTEPFRPFYRFDGACTRNCSFVSGEGSAAFWTLVPALLAPPPVRVAAVGASLAFGMGVGGLRMAFGGHYLSDTVFAALFTWTVAWLVWRVVRPTATPIGGRLPEAGATRRPTRRIAKT